MKKFAVFDVDGTQFKSSCAEKVIDESITQGLFSADAFKEAFETRRKWQTNNNEGIYQAYLHQLVGSFITSIAGVSVGDFDRVIANMVNRHSVRTFRFPSNLLTTLGDIHEAIAISGSPRIVVEPFVRPMHFASVIGSEFESIDGVFTGNAKSINKKSVIDEMCVDDAEVSVGIGDTIGDLAVLQAARCPIAFNPSRTLRKVAVSHGWYIVMEQKDAITQLIPEDGDYKVVFDDSPSAILEHAGVV